MTRSVIVTLQLAIVAQALSPTSSPLVPLEDVMENLLFRRLIENTADKLFGRALKAPAASQQHTDLDSALDGKYALHQVGLHIGQTAFDVGLLYIVARFAMNMIDPMKTEKMRSKAASKARAVRSKRSGRSHVPTNEYEDVIAQDIVDVDQLSTSFQQIGGLDEQKRHIFELAILPLRQPEIFAQNELISIPSGILLYGPPGTGKTTLAKAVARESGATFIDLKVSTLMNKWFGESQKLVRAIFSLAHKLAPTIIFIDEIDGFMRTRGEGDSGALGIMKAEFMQLWDGLSTPKPNMHRRFQTEGCHDEKLGYGVLIIGATNRPHDIDPAILRRMPTSFEVGLPNTREREHILQLMLTGQCLEPNLDLGELAKRTTGYSGSDLKELCRAAAMAPVREAVARSPEYEAEPFTNADCTPRRVHMRPLSMVDFESCLNSTRPSTDMAEEFGLREQVRANEEAIENAGAIVSTARMAQSLLRRSLSSLWEWCNTTPISILRDMLLSTDPRQQQDQTQVVQLEPRPQLQAQQELPPQVQSQPQPQPRQHDEDLWKLEA